MNKILTGLVSLLTLCQVGVFQCTDTASGTPYLRRGAEERPHGGA